MTIFQNMKDDKKTWQNRKTRVYEKVEQINKTREQQKQEKKNLILIQH